MHTVGTWAIYVQTAKREGTAMARINVFDVAKWFLSKEPIEHKKLQKLCYYAQAWSCALLGEPMFDEEIQAWVHGPVIPSLFRQYKGYGWQPIPQTQCTANFSEQQLEILNSVWETYGGFNGAQLESLTHSEQPWQNARKGLELWEISHNAIDCKAMAEYYKNKYVEAQGD